MGDLSRLSELSESAATACWDRIQRLARVAYTEEGDLTPVLVMADELHFGGSGDVAVTLLHQIADSPVTAPHDSAAASALVPLHLAELYATLAYRRPAEPVRR